MILKIRLILIMTASEISATVILMGILQVLAGVFRLGKFMRMVPHPVMLGFVNGLAIVIFLAQMEQFMPGISQVFLLTDHAVRSDLLTLSLTVGEKPSAQLVAVTKSEDDAKAMVAQLEKAVAGFKKMKAAMKKTGMHD